MALRMTSPCKPGRNGVYYFRKRVPADLAGALGKAEVKFSLKTKDPSEAKRLCREADARISNEWEVLRKKPEPLPLKVIMALAGQAYRRFVEQLDLEPGEPGVLETARARCIAEAEQGNFEGWYGPTADSLLLEYGHRADNASRERLLEEIHKAVLQGIGVALRKAHGDWRPDPEAERFPDIASKPPRPKSGNVSFEAIFSAWKASREDLRPNTVKEWERILDELKAFVKHDDAARVSPLDIRDWTDALIAKGLSRRTVKEKKLAAVRAIYKAAIGKFLVTSDPTQGVKIVVGKRKIVRSKGFTDDEAKLILLAARNADKTAGNAGERLKLAYRWMPWLCAYTGARGGEIAQLRKEDVRELGDIPFIRITPEAGTVKAGVFRDVPLHPYLVEQGFLDFVKGRPSGALFYVEHDREPGETRNPWDNVRDKVGQWTKKVAHITDRSIQPTHAWRHRFKTLCRELGIEPTYANAIQGHAEPGAAAGYGEFPLSALDREIRKLPRFP